MEQIIRQYAVVHNGMVQIPLPEEYNDQPVEVQVILTKKAAETGEEPQPVRKGGLGHLVGSLRHLPTEEKAEMNRELQELRDSWERNI